MHSLYAAGLPVPQTYSLTRNVLVMEFLGENGWPAPRLKDVELTKKSYDRVYKRLILILREMYQKCRLVHGDLSEYNLLYYKKDIWIIDVSQSVEHDHPHSLDFLRMDITNITEFFTKKKGMSGVKGRERRRNRGRKEGGEVKRKKGEYLNRLNGMRSRCF